MAHYHRHAGSVPPENLGAMGDVRGLWEGTPRGKFADGRSGVDRSGTTYRALCNLAQSGPGDIGSHGKSQLKSGLFRDNVTGAKDPGSRFCGRSGAEVVPDRVCEALSWLLESET